MEYSKRSAVSTQLYDTIPPMTYQTRREKYINGHVQYLRQIVFVCMGEIFQNYSWIQDFEADFP